MIFTIVVIVLSGRARPHITPLLPLALAAVVTYALTNSTLSSSYRENNFKGLFAILLVFSLATIAFNDSDDASQIINGVLLAGKINIIWIFIQFIFGNILHFDINNFIFNETLHMTEQASQTKASGLVATGLCWNAGGIVAALVLVFALVGGLWRFAAFVAGLLTQSSTMIVGMCVVLLYFIIQVIISRKFYKHINKTNIVIGLSAVTAILLPILFSSKMQQMLEKVISTTMQRVLNIFGSNSTLDSSAAAHFGYYTNLPKLTGAMSLKQLLFGYGIDCSGLPYTRLTQQYWWLDAWFLESDISNTLLGMGCVGIVSLYGFLLYVLVKKWKSQKILAVVMLSFIICGFFYDIQSVTYYWLLLVEYALLKYQKNEIVGNRLNDLRKQAY